MQKKYLSNERITVNYFCNLGKWKASGCRRQQKFYFYQEKNGEYEMVTKIQKSKTK